MWHIKNLVVFYYEAKIIIEMQEKLLTFCATKNWPATIFFSRIYSSMDKLLSFQKKITNFFSIVQGSAREKTQQLLSIRGFTLMIRENNYETAVTYMNPITSPLKTITDPLKEIKWSKQTQKKVPSQIFFLLVPLGTIAQLFTKKKFPTSQSL